MNMPRMRFYVSRRLTVFLLVAGVVICLGILDWFRILQEPRSMIVRILSPVAMLADRAGLWVKGKVTETEEESGEKLREERDWLLSELVRLREVERENAFLRKELEIGDPDELHRIAAQVIAKDPSGTGSYVIINRGCADGIAKGNYMTLPGRILAGKVVECSAHTAHIMLVYDRESRIEVRFQESGSSGILRGDFGLTLFVDLIPRDAAIREGEIVVSTGLGGVPAGFFIGTVSGIETGDAELFLKARIKPAADLQRFEEVFIISLPQEN